MGDGAVGRLRVGIVGLLLYRGLPQWLRDFGSSHPRIEVCVIELNSREQLEMLPRGELDIGFVLGRHIPEALISREVFTEPFVACLPDSHPACNRSSIRVEDLRDEPFVLFSRRASPDYYAQVVDVCVNAGFYPRVRHEPRHWLSVVALVSQRAGVAIVPAPLQRAGMAGVVFKPLEGASDAVSTVQCVWSPDMETPAQQAFLRQILGCTQLAAGASK